MKRCLYIAYASHSEFAKHNFGRNEVVQDNNDSVKDNYVSDLMINSDHIEINNRVMLLPQDVQKYYKENAVKLGHNALGYNAISVTTRSKLGK